ncbi:hypothetical protein J2X72_000539 [Phyllobacterium sp. 1468]|nr:hypothetical protein [Phyllobacterium sp. 1468]
MSKIFWMLSSRNFASANDSRETLGIEAAGANDDVRLEDAIVVPIVSRETCSMAPHLTLGSVLPIKAKIRISESCGS